MISTNNNSYRVQNFELGRDLTIDYSVKGNRLRKGIDDSIEIIPKTPGEVIGEQIIRPLIDTTYDWSVRSFQAIKWGFSYIDDILSRTLNFLPVAKATSTDCLFSDCPSLEKSNLHQREVHAIEGGFLSFNTVLTGLFRDNFNETQELLRFRKDDPRDKLLFICAEHDNNGAMEPWKIYPLVSELNKIFDIKYRVMTSFSNICSEIKSAKEVGKLAHVIICAHGSPKSISGLPLTLTKFEYIKDLIFNNYYKNCFSGLATDGKIILISCSTGKPQNGDSYDNYAQRLATNSRRTVLGAVAPIAGGHLKVLKKQPHSMLKIVSQSSFQALLGDNSLKEFSPNYVCAELVEKDLHTREKQAIESIENNLIRDDLLPVSRTFKQTQDYLRLCSQNPREKFLYLSAELDPDETLHPKQTSDFLVNLVDKFDFKFKVIKRYQDICEEVNSAVKIGKVAAVLIHAHRSENPYGLLLSSETTWSESAYNLFQGEFPNCLSQLPKSARIVILSDSIGASPNESPTNTIAFKIANKAKRTVIAPIGSFNFSSNFVLKSTDPVDIVHNHNSELFKVFTPPEIPLHEDL